MKKEVVKLKSAEKLYREFDNTCTSRAMIKETGICANLIYIIEVIFIALVIFIYYFYKFYKLGFKFNAKTFEMISIHDGKSFLCYIGTLLFFMFITVVTLFIGENVLTNKVMDTFGIEKKYKKIFNKTSEVDTDKSIKKKWCKNAIYKIISKIQVPSVNETIKEYLEEEKEKFIKKQLQGYSKEQLMTIYKFMENSIRNVSLEIANTSNINIYISFLTVFLTVFLTNLLSFDNIENMKDIIIVLVFTLIVIVSSYFLYKFLIYLYKKYETNLLLGYLKKEEKQMKQFIEVLKDVIINYDYYFNDKENVSEVGKQLSLDIEKHPFSLKSVKNDINKLRTRFLHRSKNK